MITETLPLLLFVLFGLFSPGPNVVMLTASGARFGFRATIPHLFGVPFGTGLLAAGSAFGLSILLLTQPGLKLLFQTGAALWILWLAWQTAFAGRSTKAEDCGVPFTFFQAILFQAVNPKLWAITLAASAGFGIGLAPITRRCAYSLFSRALISECAFFGQRLAICFRFTCAPRKFGVFS